MDRRMEPNWRYFNEDAWYIRYTCEDAAFSCKMILIHIDCRNYAQIFRLLFRNRQPAPHLPSFQTL